MTYTTSTENLQQIYEITVDVSTRCCYYDAETLLKSLIFHLWQFSLLVFKFPPSWVRRHLEQLVLMLQVGERYTIILDIVINMIHIYMLRNY